MIQTDHDPQARFADMIGAEHVRPATAVDSVDGLQPKVVVAPGSDEEVAAVLRAANEARLSVTPRGGGTKMRWGNTPRGADVVVSTERLVRLLEHAHGDMTAIVEAGMTIGAAQEALREHGQMLALDPAWPERATIGGVIAADASGPLRVRYGTMRDLLIGITVALPDGTVARGGGKVVKNVAGYDLMKLFTGSLGTLGLITSATLRLHPLPPSRASLYVQAPTALAAEGFVLELNGSTLTPSGVQIVSTPEGYGICVRFAGVDASMEAQSSSLAARAAAAKLAVTRLDETEAEAAWNAHATIYGESTDGPMVVARISVLPASIAGALDGLAKIGERLRLITRMVVYGNGTGFVRFESPNAATLAAAIAAAQARMTEVGGHLTVHLLPDEIKERLDVWGAAGDTLPLMRRIKAQFDPAGIMNPGRQIGRI